MKFFIFGNEEDSDGMRRGAGVARNPRPPPTPPPTSRNYNNCRGLFTLLTLAFMYAETPGKIHLDEKHIFSRNVGFHSKKAAIIPRG